MTPEGKKKHEPSTRDKLEETWRFYREKKDAKTYDCN